MLDAKTLSSLDERERLALTLRLPANRVQAHQIFFKHRHTDQTPAFHEQIIREWYGSSPRVLFMAFREGGKSTISEEAVILGAFWKLFHNCLIIGESEPMAFDRLRSIKHEIETNEDLIGLYGEIKGPVWNEGRVELSNGICIQARGRGQALRGTKFLQWRPDWCLADDLEDEEHVRDADARQETKSWFFGKLIPALDKSHRIRMTATPLDAEALPMTILKMSTWSSRVYPIEHIDLEGNRQATWPSRYPLQWIDEKKDEMYALGLGHDYQREYMCQPEDPSKKIFTADIIRVVPRTHLWQPIYLFYDPARTKTATSASTGWAAWSYLHRKIIVWDAGAGLWMPDEMRDHIFAMDDLYQPVTIGIEQTGLNEYLLQPLRAEQLRRSIILPIEAVDAPRNKLAFIEGLQPYFTGGDIEFAKDLPELRAQLLSYPTGRIDVPNALAYALRMRPGEVVFPGFGHDNVFESLFPRRRDKFILALNSTGSYTTGVLAQVLNGGLSIFADYVRDSAPGLVLEDILGSARVDIAAMAASSPGLACFAPPRHFGDYDPIGLRGAAAKVQLDVSLGSEPQVGRDEIRSLLSRRDARGEPLVRVLVGARWTLNALSSGYCYPVDKRGRLSPDPKSNAYSCLAEGLESIAGLLQGNRLDFANVRNVAFTESGQPYLSALPNQRPLAEQKILK
jgi:hypothetical protein